MQPGGAASVDLRGISVRQFAHTGIYGRSISPDVVNRNRRLTTWRQRECALKTLSQATGTATQLGSANLIEYPIACSQNCLIVQTIGKPKARTELVPICFVVALYTDEAQCAGYAARARIRGGWI